MDTLKLLDDKPDQVIWTSGHAGFLRLFLFGVPDASIPVSVAVLNAIDEFLKCCKRF